MSTRSLHELLPAGTQRLVTHFLLHPEEKLHFRALRRRTGLGTGALQRELGRLVKMGLLVRTDAEGRTYYSPMVDHPSWRAFRTLLREHADPVDVLREALRGVSGIRAAFVYGSTVRGDARPDSDIDVFIVEEGMPLHEFGRAATEAESLLACTIDISCHTPASLRQKLERGSSYLHAALSGPKAWLVGSEELLPRGEEA